MSKKLLVKFSGNWADEMDIVGFQIMSEDEWNFKIKEAKECQFPAEICVGTNQYVDFDTPEDYLNSFEIKEITEGEEKIIKRLILTKGSYCRSYYGEIPLMEGEAPKEFYEKNGHCPE